MKRRRAFALALCVLVTLCLLVTSALIAREMSHPHHCVGEHCPICQFISQIGQTRRELGQMLMICLMAALALSLGRRFAVVAEGALPGLDTPISRKIRLNS